MIHFNIPSRAPKKNAVPSPALGGLASRRRRLQSDPDESLSERPRPPSGAQAHRMASGPSETPRAVSPDPKSRTLRLFRRPASRDAEGTRHPEILLSERSEFGEFRRGAGASSRRSGQPATFSVPFLVDQKGDTPDSPNENAPHPTATKKPKRLPTPHGKSNPSVDVKTANRRKTRNFRQETPAGGPNLVPRRLGCMIVVL